MQDKFIIPPLSVFDTRQGYWQERKNLWKEKIHSLDGRDSELIANEDFVRALSKTLPTTSEFDPVLCEILLKWFCPAKGKVIDPFAGGSVRGIVSAMLDREYTGVDLSKRQIEANEQNWSELHLSGRKPIWIVGDSRDIDSLVECNDFDFFLACPPYADLEQYSDDPKDLSNLDYKEFVSSYTEIIRKTCAKLKDNAFASVVITEIRDKKTGRYRGFIEDTKNAFKEAGLSLYNDIVLINQYGTAPARTSHVFPISRKVGKVHQNVLVFLKGNEKEIIKNLEEVEVPQEETGV